MLVFCVRVVACCFFPAILTGKNLNFGRKSSASRATDKNFAYSVTAKHAVLDERGIATSAMLFLELLLLVLQSKNLSERKFELLLQG